MAGMLQILTWLLCVYLVFKGMEILQVALASPRENKSGIVIFGWLALGAAIILAIGFALLQNEMASEISRSTSNLGT